MKACTAKGWAVWLFLVFLAVGRAGAQDDKNIVASHLGPVCDLSAALKFVAAKAKEARSCIPDDAAGGEGTDTVLFAKAFGAAWRCGDDDTNDTVRDILLETRVFAQRAERAQRIAPLSEHLAAMATEKADRIDEFVRMLANYKAAGSSNSYCLGDGSAAAVGTNNADPDDAGSTVGTGSNGKAEKLKGCSGTGTSKGSMVYAKGKWESDGHAKALTEALAAFNSQWTTSNGKAVSAGSNGATCPLAKVGASGGAGYTAGKITFAGMFTAKTSSGLALLFKGSEKAGLDDVQALITRLTQLTTLADTGLQHRKFLCVPSTDTTEHTTDATGLAKAAAAIYDELQAREAAAKARRHTPKEQGQGEQHATASPAATERKAEEGSSQARSEPMEKQTAGAAHRSADTNAARAWHALLAACSAAAMATRT
ncbi:hypothetical protein ERJ75_000809300 [Trypanosoma vivax]|nr:hypothetical protein ERJ75_000809300 [Trypanosoma vivax]